MRRFVRTFFVRRAAMFLVIQDSGALAFECWRYTAEDGVEIIGRYAYTSATEREARNAAVTQAQERAAQATATRDLEEPAPVDQTAERLGIGYRRPMSVCDGWTEPRHARKILSPGDPARVSHGMCASCEKDMDR